MDTLTINIPESLNLNTHDVTMVLASKFYEDGKLSLGQAAKMANLTKRTFIELLGKYEVSIFNRLLSDLHSDIINA